MDDISPLFAVEAEQLLLAGFTREAIDLCRKGLEQYPDYPTALAVLARAYETAGEAGKAGEALRAAIELSPAQRNIRQMAGNLERYGRIAPSGSGQAAESRLGEDESIESERGIEEPAGTEMTFEELSLEEPPLEELLWNDTRVAEVEEFSAGPEAEGMRAAEEYAEEPGLRLSEPEPADDLQIDITSYQSFGLTPQENKGPALVPMPAESVAGTAEDDACLAYTESGLQIEEKNTIQKGQKPKLKDLIAAMRTGESEAPAGPDSSDIGLIPGLEFLVEDIARKEFEFKRPGIGLMHSIDVIESLRDKYPAGKATIEDDPFLKLAGKLENAKIPQATREEPSEPEPEEPDGEQCPTGGPTVVSETLANIYRLQGAYDNAIEAYTRLMEMHPENASEYSRKIEEIRQIITRDAAK